MATFNIVEDPDGRHQIWDFIDLQGMPGFVKEHIQAINRPGVNGTLYVSNGKFGEPFGLVGVRDHRNTVYARMALFHYSNLIGQEVGITWRDMEMDGVMIENVEVEGLHSMSNMSGGVDTYVSSLSSKSGVIQRVNFTMRFLVSVGGHVGGLI